MASFKVRRKTLAKGGLQVGSGGTVNDLLFGTTTLTAPSLAAATSGSADLTISGLDAGDAVFVTTASLPSGVLLVGASATAADTARLRFYNTGAASTASALVSLSYVALA